MSDGPRSVLHADMDAFFASVEQLDDPSLRGRPVVVGGTPEGRGVVCAASYEARRFGVHSAMSAWRARQLCPEAAFVTPRHERYAEVSEEVFAIFETFTPLVEPVSVDEAYLDVTGCEGLFGTPEEIGRQIKSKIKNDVGLTASVGVAPNKMLAKLASDLEKPDGLVVVPPGRAREFLAPLDVGRLPGVGQATGRLLQRLGIRTVGDLARHPRSELEAALGSFAPTLLEFAEGRDDRPVVTEGEPKSVGAEETFATDLSDDGDLERELDALVDRVATRLRRSALAGRTVTLKARYPDFATVTRASTLPVPTDLTEVLRATARQLLATARERDGRPLRLLGVTVANLAPAGSGQGLLFRRAEEERAGRRDQATDRIRSRFGRAALTWANQLPPAEPLSEPPNSPAGAPTKYAVPVRPRPAPGRRGGPRP